MDFQIAQINPQRPLAKKLHDFVLSQIALYINKVGATFT